MIPVATAIVDLAALPAIVAARAGDGRAVVVHDERVASSEIVAAVVALTRSEADSIVVHAAPADVAAHRVEGLTAVLAGADVVVAVGGGRVLDAVKLAVLMAADGGVGGRLADDPSPAVLLTASARPVPVVAVPTTLGTGAERSQSVVIDTAEGRRIIGAPGLRPSHALLDPLASRGLPGDLVLAGVFEALARTVGPVSAGATARSSDLVVAAGRRLLALGDALSGLVAPGGASGDRLRAEVAALSAFGHGFSLHGQRSADSFAAWFVATEVSWVTGMEKAPAMAAVLPSTWRATTANPRWGDATTIERVWQAVADSPGGADLAGGVDPGAELEEVARRWGVAVDLDIDEAGRQQIAGRVVTRWGPTGLIPGISSDDVVAVIPQRSARGAA